jgi:flagellar basal-body rod protein FlgG
VIRALYTAATGMTAQQLNIDVISNNMANVNTLAYKKSRAEFQDLLYQALRTPGGTAAAGILQPTGMQLGHGVRPSAIKKDFTVGDFKETNNPLDVAIEGKGFFQVLMPDGNIAYTRAGAFNVDSDGNVVTSDGFAMEPALTIPTDSTSVIIGVDGTVSVYTPGTTAATEVGNIELASFVNPAGLESVGRSLYKPTQASGDATTGTPGLEGIGTIAQGFLEMTNVNIVDEMVELIAAQRAYELNSKAIQAADDLLTVAANLRR